MARRNKQNYKKNNIIREKEPDNYQDLAEEREYSKGKFRGKQLQRKFDARKFKPMDILNNGSKPLSIPGSNDDSWHVPTQELVDSTSKINFQVSDGLPLNFSYVDNSTTAGQATITRDSIASPGICVFEVFNTIGETNLQSDPFNQAGSMLFSYLQRTTGRAPSYSQAQVQMYLLSVANAYAYYQVMCRIYGLCNHRNFQSRYVPEALVNALHCDYNSLRSQLANFRTMINQYALDISTLPLPANVTYVDWLLHQFEYVYKDSETEKAQLYAFVPAGFYVWVEGDASHPTTYLKYEKFNTVGNKDYTMTLSALKTFGQQMLDPLFYSEDFRMIKADILATFGDNLVNVTQLAETYVTEPVYNAEIASVIENAYVYGIETSAINSIIEEDTSLNGGAVMAQYEYTLYGWENLINSGTFMKKDFLGTLQTQEILFNWHEETPPSPERCLTLTRYSGTGCTAPTVSSDGTEYVFHGFRNNCYNIICSMQIHTFKYSSANEGKPFVSSRRYATLNPVSFDSVSVAHPAPLWSKFDWAPSIRNVWYQLGSESGTPTAALYIEDYLCDIDQFAIIPSEQLRNMNDISMRGEFTPRGLGGYSPIK